MRLSVAEFPARLWDGPVAMPQWPEAGWTSFELLEQPPLAGAREAKIPAHQLERRLAFVGK